MFSTTALSVFFLLGHNAGCLRPLLKGFANRLTPSGFGRDLKLCPRVLARLEPRAKISERLRRFQLSNLPNGTLQDPVGYSFQNFRRHRFVNLPVFGW